MIEKIGFTEITHVLDSQILDYLNKSMDLLSKDNLSGASSFADRAGIVVDSAFRLGCLSSADYKTISDALFDYSTFLWIR